MDYKLLFFTNYILNKRGNFVSYSLDINGNRENTNVLGKYHLIIHNDNPYLIYSMEKMTPNYIQHLISSNKPLYEGDFNLINMIDFLDRYNKNHVLSDIIYKYSIINRNDVINDIINITESTN